MSSMNKKAAIDIEKNKQDLRGKSLNIFPIRILLKKF